MPIMNLLLQWATSPPLIQLRSHFKANCMWHMHVLLLGVLTEESIAKESIATELCLGSPLPYA